MAVQTAVGISCVALGLLHFVERDREPEATRSFFVGSLVPRSVGARAGLALVEIAAGFALLFSA